MKIKLSNQPKLVTFGNIETGEAFFYPDGVVDDVNLYIKMNRVPTARTPDMAEGFQNAVCLYDGTTIGIFDDEEVKRAAVTVISSFEGRD